MVDSGAYYHASPRRESFCIYQSGQFGVFKMGNKGTIEIVGTDNVKIKTNLGYEMILKDVRHIANLRLNLLLVRRLDDEGLAEDCGS